MPVSEGSGSTLERESTSEEQRRGEAVYDFLLVDDNKGESMIDTGNTKTDNIKADPMYLNVMINRKKIDMEIDSGPITLRLFRKVIKINIFPKVKSRARRQRKMHMANFH